MAAAAYEGGAGGKFPKRPSRRAPATPYDRPSAAARGGRHPAAAEPGGSRWLSKLVDPASRIIARSASRLFSSVFRKRLAAPPAAPEENHRSRQEDPEVPSTNSSSEVGEQRGCGGEKAKDNCDAAGAWEEMNLDIGGISELEQLLKQKTFTRVEFDRLTELLRSRTIEPSTSQPAVNYVNEEKANISEQVNQNKEFTAEPSTSKRADSHDRKANPNVPEQEAIASFILRGSVTTPVSLAIPEEEAASPAEIAKAYMGSRSLKVSPSTLSLRSQIFQEDAVPQAKKSLDMAIAPRSAVRFSGVPEHTENGYMIARPHGRSAIYRMSRSPYFKAHPVTTIRGDRSLDGGSGLSTSSQWTSTNVMQSGSKSAMKRGSSVLDSDVGSLGPIRRIRRKSNVMSPSRNIQSSLPRNLLPTPSVPLARDANQGSASSIQKPLHLDGATDLQHAENGHNRTPSGGVVPIPPQSSEMARKILQQLDKLVPSPKEKSSELKIIDRHESPSKLTRNMLHGRALKSMEDIDSSKFLKVQAYDNLDIASSSHLKGIRSSTFQKQERAGENGPLKPDVRGLQATSEALDRNKSVVSATEAKPGMKSAEFAISVTATVPSQKKPSFQMSAPEDSLDLDDDDYSIKDSSGLASTGNAKLELISESKTPDITSLERSLGSSSNSMPSSTLILDKRSEVKASDKPVSEKNAAFLFPTASPSSISSQMHSPPRPAPLVERSTPRKEEIAGHTFKFGSKDAESSPLSSTMAAVSNPASLKFGASNDAPETLLDRSKLDNGGDQKAGDVFKSCGNPVSGLSSSTSPVLFAFGASTTPTLSNGSLTAASSTSVISAAPAMTFSDNLATSVFSTSIITSTSSGSPTVSSATPVFSTVPSFQFGSGASTSASISVAPSLEKPDSNGLEEKPVKALPFGLSSFIAPGSSAAHSITGSNSAASATSSVFASMGTSSSSSVVQASPLFSSMTSGSLALSTSSVFSGNGVFGSSASAHSSSENLSVANSSSQSLPSTFGAAGGSIFDTQATKTGTGVSNISQNSPSQFGSFTSQPVVGLTGSSSSGSASSLFGSATPTKPFGTSSIVSFSTSADSSSSSASSVSLSTAAFGTSSGFSFSSGAVSSYSSGSSTSFAPTTPFGSSSGFSFSTGAGLSSSFVSSSSFAPTAANMFNSSSQLPMSSNFGSTFGSTTPTPSTGFSFGLSAPSSGSSRFTFGTSSGPAFSFTSAGTTTSSTSPLTFGVQNPTVSFGSGSPGNDQMNVEDSMADDTTQASAPVVPTFGQQTNLTATPSFMFSSPAAPSGGPSIFQFGGQQNTNNPQNPSPFQAAGSLEFVAGGSFSLGSGGGGGDKSGRKIVRVRRDKLRKK
ncbi:nuclear pore complex protein NUP1-like isoform X2 [Phoenix dactylifera]|uniref:Nuclear pore complex protein NUP1-like isoform X2 n=1 Tax=Phoenix dactylifera TaxID=42345 RepID=A0A8B7C2J6_PHODC|nr:nuclear pore complex protein NUP1-like isoform X2 [Phoenix dactylifera]